MTATLPPDPPPKQPCADAQIVVAVPTLNEAGFIAECLTSLGIDTQEMAQVAFVVADGGSTDGTVKIVSDMAKTRTNLHLLHNPDRLQSAGVNAVAALFPTLFPALSPATAAPNATDAAILVRCDAHAVYPKGYVRDLAASLKASKAASVVVAMDAAGRGCFAKGAAWIVDTKLGSGGAAHRGGTASRFVDHGHHAAFDLSWFNAIGGYDATFSHNEDAEYDHRLAQAGGTIWLNAALRLTYFMRPTPARLARQYYTYGRGRMRTLLKHAARPKLRQMLPVALLGIVVSSLLLGVFVTPWGFLGAAGYGALLAATSVWLAVQKRALCGLWAGVALGVMHLSWGLGASLMWLAYLRSARR